MNLRAWTATVLLGLPVLASAQTSPAPALEYLQRVQAAAQHLNYTGVFVYQHGTHVETSRITHVIDAAGEFEKLETLDGSPRVIFRNNDKVYCVLPDSRKVMVERRRASKFFPSLLPKPIGDLGQYYDIKLGHRGRVAERDAQQIVLEPRDEYRFGHTFWIDSASGLLLKASTLDEKKKMVDQYAFTQIEIGQPIDRDKVTPKLAGKDIVTESIDPAGGAEDQPSPWVLTRVPPGFTKIVDAMRMMPGRPSPVRHIVFSDGLAAFSIFIESPTSTEKITPGLATQAAINMYTRVMGGTVIRVLGEAPATTVIQVANAVAKAAK